MKKTYRIMLATSLIILGIWGILTLWAEMPGPAKTWSYGQPSAPVKILVVFDPDPIYNLDEQLCKAFGETIAEHNVRAIVATVKATKNLPSDNYDMYLLCANTYNWRPDRAVSNYTKNTPQLKGKKVIALTLGSGSTKEAKEAFDKIIKSTGAHLLASKTLWLLRPNDETRIKEPNVHVAIAMTKQWAVETVNTMNTKHEP